MDARMHGWMDGWMDGWMEIDIDIYNNHTHINVSKLYAYVCVIYIYIRIYMCIMCMYIYIYIHPYIRVYIYIHTYMYMINITGASRRHRTPWQVPASTPWSGPCWLQRRPSSRGRYEKRRRRSSRPWRRDRGDHGGGLLVMENMEIHTGINVGFNGFKMVYTAVCDGIWK